MDIVRVKRGLLCICTVFAAKKISIKIGKGSSEKQVKRNRQKEDIVMTSKAGGVNNSLKSINSASSIGLNFNERV